jgi:2,3-bisphosphoglycerate-independent phosphoglycerate mutase
MLALIIMDGWGYRAEEYGNAIAHAKTPFFDSFNGKIPKTLLNASGSAVGLIDGQMGNSEVGHLNIGAGRIVHQELPRISMAIEEGSFFKNEAFSDSMDNVLKNNSSLHLIGLLSDGGVHSHINHLFALMKMAKEKGVNNLFIHPLLDGRDTDPKIGDKFLKELEDEISKLGLGKIATIMGRYYGMDRDNRWDREEKAYNALVMGTGNKARSAAEAIQNSFKEGVTDEFVIPTVIEDESGNPTVTIKDNDSIIFFNFRADRMRQIVKSFYLSDFSFFERKVWPKVNLTTLTEYDHTLDIPVAFPPHQLKNTLGEVLSKKGIKQLRIAETEKYAHVTFFFNGGVEEPNDGEDRVLIPSPKVATYDLQPEMSADGVMNGVLNSVREGKHEVIIVNFANTDMVGHTGIFDAAVKAVETVDGCVGQIVKEIRDRGGDVLITADHGNAEDMMNRNGSPVTAHSINKVPFYCISGKDLQLKKEGRLADIAPTILQLLEIEKPEEMSGESLIL